MWIIEVYGFFKMEEDNKHIDPKTGEPYSGLETYEEFHAFIREAKKGNGEIIRSEVYENTKKLKMPTEYSQEFVGMYLHGGHRPFSVFEHEPAFASFRKFSEKLWPIYFFYAEEPDHDDAGMREMAKKYAPVKLIQIPVLKTIHEYSDFMFFEAFQKIPEEHENILCFQHDGFIKIPGWENFIREHDPDFMGAPWHSPLDPNGVSFKKGVNMDIPDDVEIYVGNGGFSFRKRSKMLEVSNLLKKGDIIWEGPHGVEDSVYCLLGFGKGIFKEVDPEVAGDFSHEPYNREYGIGFHGYI